MRDNAVSGPFPSLSGFTNLEVLDLSFTFLGGPFPSFSGLTSLRVIDLTATTRAEHTLQDDDWADLGQLQSLLLSKAILDGTLPSSLASLTSLKTLDIRDTFVKGTVPEFIGDLVALGKYAKERKASCAVSKL